MYHTPTPVSCQYCEFTTNDQENLQTHMINSHEEVVVLYTMAKQVDGFCDSFEGFETFIKEVSVSLKTVLSNQSVILDNQNAMKQELFVLRNGQAEIAQARSTSPSSSRGPAEPELSPPSQTRNTSLPPTNRTTNDDKTSSPNDRNSSPLNGDARTDDNDGKKAQKKNENTSTSNIHAKDASEKQKVVWIGTSLSKPLDAKKFEKDLNVKLRLVKAYCVDDEGRYPKSSFRSIVPDAVKGADILVLQTGSIEISNIDVNNAMMDTSREIDDYKREWFNKVELASSSLFKIAEECTAAYPNLNVIVVKRPPRFDRSSKDILGIKPKLSEFGNTVYDQLHIKSNFSDRIHLVDLKLVQNSKYLKSIIYGSKDDSRFDGVHMIADGASRHFTYRAVKAILPIFQKMNKSRQTPLFARNDRIQRNAFNTGTKGRHFKSRNNYQQGQNNNQSANGYQGDRSDILYSEVLKKKDIRKIKNISGYQIPTSNRFSSFNQENC